MTILEHEVRKLYDNQPEGIKERIETIAAELLENKCPFPANIVCNDYNGDCLKCWLKEYNPEECSDEV